MNQKTLRVMIEDAEQEGYVNGFDAAMRSRSRKEKCLPWIACAGWAVAAAFIFLWMTK